jgi:hypothetical protein
MARSGPALCLTFSNAASGTPTSPASEFLPLEIKKILR